MNLADVSQLWLGHETGLREIMTIDVKDFARYRLPDGDALNHPAVSNHDKNFREAKTSKA